MTVEHGHNPYAAPAHDAHQETVKQPTHMLAVRGAWLCLLAAALQVLLNLAAFLVFTYWDSDATIPVLIAMACLLLAYATVPVQVVGMRRFAHCLGHNPLWGALPVLSILSWPALVMPFALWILWRAAPPRDPGRAKLAPWTTIDTVSVMAERCYYCDRSKASGEHLGYPICEKCRSKT